jgi:hypothetical protein
MTSGDGLSRTACDCSPAWSVRISCAGRREGPGGKRRAGTAGKTHHLECVALKQLSVRSSKRELGCSDAKRKWEKERETFGPVVSREIEVRSVRLGKCDGNYLCVVSAMRVAYWPASDPLLCPRKTFAGGALRAIFRAHGPLPPGHTNSIGAVEFFPTSTARTSNPDDFLHNHRRLARFLTQRRRLSSPSCEVRVILNIMEAT